MSVLIEDASRAVAVAVTVLEVCLAFAIIGVLLSALMLGWAALVDRPQKKTRLGAAAKRERLKGSPDRVKSGHGSQLPASPPVEGTA